MRSLAAAYALLAALAMPAALWAADDAPPPATTPAATTPSATAPSAPSPPAQPEAEQPAPDPGPSATAPAEPPSAPAGKEAVRDEPTGEPGAPRPVARAAASGGVTIEDFAFSPRTITVDEGDTVTWTNRDGVGHTATAEDGSFDTGLLARGETGSHTFDQAGTYRYQCTPHPNMTGTVVVRAASGGGGGGGADDDGGDATTTGEAVGAGSSSSGSSGSTLPATGLQVGIVFLGGVLLLGAGALLRRRLDG